MVIYELIIVIVMVIVSCDKRSPMDCLNCDQECIYRLAEARRGELVEAEERGVEAVWGRAAVRRRLMGYYGSVQALLAMSRREEEEWEDEGIGVEDREGKRIKGDKE